MDCSFLITNVCQYERVVLTYLLKLLKQHDVLVIFGMFWQNQIEAYILWPLDSAASDHRVSLH